MGHIVTNLVDRSHFVEDMQSVLDTLIPKECEVKTLKDKHYTMRINPYRTLDNVIEGLVITFVDITDRIKSQEALKKSNEEKRLAVIVEDSKDAIVVHDLKGRILAWNPAAVKIYGWTEEEALQLNMIDRIPQQNRTEELIELDQLTKSEILKTHQTKRINKAGEEVPVWITATALHNERGQIYGISSIEGYAISKRL